MKIVSSKIGTYGKSSVNLDVPENVSDYATLHNPPSNTVIGIKDIEKFLDNDNERMTMTIENRGKFSALTKTKKSNPVGYKFFIAGEKGKRIATNITVKQVLDNPEIINTIPSEELNIAYDRLEKIQCDIAKKGEKYGYKFIEI